MTLSMIKSGYQLTYDNFSIHSHSLSLGCIRQTLSSCLIQSFVWFLLFYSIVGEDNDDLVKNSKWFLYSFLSILINFYDFFYQGLVLTHPYRKELFRKLYVFWNLASSNTYHIFLGFFTYLFLGFLLSIISLFHDLRKNVFVHRLKKILSNSFLQLFSAYYLKHDKSLCPIALFKSNRLAYFFMFELCFNAWFKFLMCTKCDVF